MNDKQATPLMYATPQDFTAEFPRYVYRAHNGKETVQWREAALDMANDRAKALEALREIAADGIESVGTLRIMARVALRELGEAA